jgi:hypothetical protein
VRDNQRWMGRVDIHDQLRMQRYSLQLAGIFCKYYTTHQGALVLEIHFSSSRRVLLFS